MAVELAALQVPISAPGVDATIASLTLVDRAGTQANASLERGATRAARATTALGDTGRQAAEAWVNLERTATQFTATAQGQAGTLSGRLQPALDNYRQSIQAIQADLLRNRITTMQATNSAAAAGVVYRAEAAALTSTAVATRAASGATAIFTGQQVRAVAGVRTLTTALASQAAMAVGVRSGLGSIASSLGALALGSLTTLGIIAGLAAIAAGFRLIRDRAREAKEEVKKATDKLIEIDEKLVALRESADPLLTAQQKLREATDADTKATNAAIAAQERLAEAKAAASRPGTLGDLAVARRELNKATQEQTLADIAAQAAAKGLILARADLTKAEKTAADEKARLTKEGQQAAKERERAAAALTAATRAETAALAALAKAGIATSADLTQLIEIQAALELATRSGTAAARAQALALLEVVKAARAARAIGLLGLNSRDFKSALSKTSPPGTGLAPAPTEFPGVDPAENRLKAIQKFVGVTREQAELLGDAFAELQNFIDPVTTRIMTLSVALEAGASAWVGFWEGVGSGDLSGFTQIIAGFAKQMAQLFAQQAAAALALGLTPPPLGNPMYLKAVPKLLAVSAGFALLAGGLGGGRGASSGGGGSSRTESINRDEIFRVGPRLQVGGRSAVGERASLLQPGRPILVQVGPVIGTNDPQAQRDIARLVGNAVNRGYVLGRA